MSPPGRTVRDGLAAGLLAGFALAALFCFYDLGQGVPFRTPAFLWGAIVAGEDAVPTMTVVLGYTLLHFLAWGGLGILAAVLADRVALPRNIFIGALYGLFACSLVFYVGLFRAPVDLILSAPGWPAVLFGNALAGIIMFTHLHWVSSEPGVAGVMGFLRAHPIMRQGMMAGVLGAGAVAIWFLILDLALREPFYTPAALAGILFHGGASTDSVVVSATPVMGYSLLHFGFFILFGVLLAGVIARVERFPPLSFGLLMLFVVFEAFFISMVGALGRWGLPELTWWSIMTANLLAALTMGSYLWKIHPGLLDRLTAEAIWAD